MVLFLSVSIDPAFAAPGGKIASKIFDGFWGKLLLVAIIILFLPVITLNSMKRRAGMKRAREDLLVLAKYSCSFNMVKIVEETGKIFNIVHDCWSRGNLDNAKDYMTGWYYQNQQETVLNHRKTNGLKNVCNVKKITSICPYVVIHSNDLDNHKDSKIGVLITAVMNDYLEDSATGDVVEGSKKYKKVSKLWMFDYSDRGWILSKIEEIDMLLSYAKAMKTLPRMSDIEAGIRNDK